MRSRCGDGIIQPDTSPVQEARHGNDLLRTEYLATRTSNLIARQSRRRVLRGTPSLGPDPISRASMVSGASMTLACSSDQYESSRYPPSDHIIASQPRRQTPRPPAPHRVEQAKSRSGHSEREKRSCRGRACVRGTPSNPWSQAWYGSTGRGERNSETGAVEMRCTEQQARRSGSWLDGR